MAQPGFMIYADDWSDYAEEYSTEEIGEMVKALLSYFSAGEHTDFTDRGMRQFYRQSTKAIELDRKRYDDKCIQNAYNRYRGLCAKKGIEPLEKEEWLTSVYERQQTSTDSTNTNNQLSNPVLNNQTQIPASRGDVGESDKRVAYLRYTDNCRKEQRLPLNYDDWILIYGGRNG